MIRPWVLVLAAVALFTGLGVHRLVGADHVPLPTEPATVTVRVLVDGRLGPATAQPAVRLADGVWRQRLESEAFAILRRQGTERPGTSELLKEHRDGWFLCAGCGLPLYDSAGKFDSGTGWPSFTRAVDPAQVERIQDRSYGMVRTELRCARCGGHLGHVFDDGPAPTGERHCINGLALRFVPAAGAGSPPPAGPSGATAAPPASGPGAPPAR